ncbi:MAG: beta galactosidase jelly roll domain-containing protein [Chitinophagaceae bacterium]|nr:beta galactosidase jelly roll domain-containing protein [Chitinophagaceae bacterium]
MKGKLLRSNCSLILLALCFCFINTSFAQPYALITNVEGRHTTSLNGKWSYLTDPMQNGVRIKYYLDKELTNKAVYASYNFNAAETLTVPGDWSTQRPELLYYEGTIWYRKKFEYQPREGNRVFLHFGAVNYESTVYLNGEELGKHVGGYTPFNFEITQKLREGENSLVVQADNKRHPEGVPESVFDWWNFGGITRPVTLIETPGTFIRDYAFQLNRSRTNITGRIQLDGDNSNKKLTIEIPELKVKHTVTTDAGGRAQFEIKAKPEYWSPSNPKLYAVNIISETDNVSEEIGFRTIETQGTKVLLNGEEVFLRGANIHAQVYGRSAWSKEDAGVLLGWAKELGCNFLRLAHYPHSEAMIKVAEKMGIMVWEEIPVYWRIDFSNNDTYVNAENQLREIIDRDKNRANIIIWSVANETPRSEARTKFISRLANKAREFDASRLVSAALNGTAQIKPGTWSIEDKLINALDVIGVNQYYGWFGGTPDSLDKMKWQFDYQKPVLMTEFGASAPFGNHGDKKEKYTEECQAYYYEKTIEMIKRIPGLSGTCPWSLAEHRSPLRLMSGIEDGFSRAGLISWNGQRKKAFYVMKKYYDEFISGK